MTKMTTKMLSSILFLMLSATTLAAHLDQTTAHRAALQFLTSKNGISAKSYKNKSLKNIELKNIEKVFLFSDEQGQFVLVGEGTDAPAVVGYGQLSAAEPHESMLWMAAAMERCTRLFVLPTTEQPVAPMLKTIRTQEAPFNARCPLYYDNGQLVSEEPCKVGCVATALEQVMTYYRYPRFFKGSLKGWKTAHYEIPDVPVTSKIKFANILDVYEPGHYRQNHIDAVADLSYWCGVAAQMNWGLSESGASLYRLVDPMQRAFGYRYVRYLDATELTPQRWRETIDAELDAGRPIVYAGYTTLVQGHAFVVDGRDADGLYHINWGYGGQYDGYFDLAVLNTFEPAAWPTAEGRWLGHSCGQEMLLLHPDAQDYVEDEPLSPDGLRIDTVVFNRIPDSNGYVTAFVSVSNSKTTDLNAFLELFTYQPNDTSTVTPVDLVAVTGGDIAAGGSSCLLAYCKFTKLGERVFAITADGRTLLYVDTLTVNTAHGNGLLVEHVDTLTETGTENLQFCVTLRNKSDEAWTGNMITYSLFVGDYTTAGGDHRQWRIENVAPASTVTDTISFGPLDRTLTYTFVVRNPWQPAYTLKIPAIGTTGIYRVNDETDRRRLVYDLHGRVLRQKGRGIMVGRGHKYWNP